MKMRKYIEVQRSDLDIHQFPNTKKFYEILFIPLKIMFRDFIDFLEQTQNIVGRQFIK